MTGIPRLHLMVLVPMLLVSRDATPQTRAIEGLDALSTTLDREQMAMIGYLAGNAAWDAGCNEAAYRLYRDAFVKVATVDHPELAANLESALRRMGRHEAAAILHDILEAAEGRKPTVSIGDFASSGTDGVPLPPNAPAAPAPATPPYVPPPPGFPNVAAPPIASRSSVDALNAPAAVQSDSDRWSWRHLVHPRTDGWTGWAGKYGAYFLGFILMLFFLEGEGWCFLLGLIGSGLVGAAARLL